MWPYDPDDFESLTQPPADQSHDDAWYFVFIGQDILCVSENGSPRPILADEMRWLELERHAEIYLGRYQGRSCFAVVAIGRRAAGLCAAGPARLARSRRSVGVLSRGPRATAGRLGARPPRSADAVAPRCRIIASIAPKRCPECGLINYPRLVAEHHRVGPQRRGDAAGAQCELAAGNVSRRSPASSNRASRSSRRCTEKCSKRSVCASKNVRYLGSQSWPFPNSLMLGFHADYASGDIVCQEGEIADARWFRVLGSAGRSARHRDLAVADRSLHRRDESA